MHNNKQRGLSLGGLLGVLVLVAIVALLGMKLIPAYMEYGTAKNAIESISRDKQTGSPTEIRRAFDARASIDNITAVRPSDLEITKEGGEVVIAFAYRKEVPLFSNVGVYFDFAASTRSQ